MMMMVPQQQFHNGRSPHHHQTPQYTTYFDQFGTPLVPQYVANHDRRLEVVMDGGSIIGRNYKYTEDDDDDDDEEEAMFNDTGIDRDEVSVAIASVHSKEQLDRYVPQLTSSAGHRVLLLSRHQLLLASLACNNYLANVARPDVYKFPVLDLFFDMC